jgi:hypothetical protein
MIKYALPAAVAAIALAAPLAAQAQTVLVPVNAPPYNAKATPISAPAGAGVTVVGQPDMSGRVDSGAPIGLQPMAQPTALVPLPGAVWIDGHYDWNPATQNYVWLEGQYTLPPRPGAQWVPGHWQQGPNAWAWVDGDWN